MSYDLVYVNGCSYMKGKDEHGPWLDYYLARHFNCEHINRAIEGSCNSRIIRSSMRDALTYKDKKILMILGLSFLFRTEVWIPEQVKQYDKFDGDFRSFQVPHTPTWFESLREGKRIMKNENLTTKRTAEYLHSFYRVYDEEAAYLNLVSNLLGFTGFCKSNNIDYVIFPAAEKMPPSGKVDVQSDFLRDFQKEINNDDRILPINDFYFNSFSLENNFVPYDFDEFGEQGHHGSAAFKHFAKFLIERYNW